MRPGERDRAIEEWSQCDAHARQRSVEQLGLHGDGGAGLESQELVWVARAGARTRTGTGADGVPAIPQCDPVDSMSGGANGTAADLPRAELQSLAQRFFFDVGTTAKACVCPIGTSPEHFSKLLTDAVSLRLAKKGRLNPLFSGNNGDKANRRPTGRSDHANDEISGAQIGQVMQWPLCFPTFACFRASGAR